MDCQTHQPLEGPQLFEDEPDEDAVHDIGNLTGFQQIFVVPLRISCVGSLLLLGNTQLLNENHT